VSAGANSTCTATPNAGYLIQTWTGACAFVGSNPQCPLTNIQENKVSTVRFAAAIIPPPEPPPVTPTAARLINLSSRG
jgi:hypothetical protein